MFKSTITFALVLILFTTATASFFEELKPGLELGMNYSSIWYESEFWIWEDYAWRMIPSIGIFLEKDLSPIISFKPGLKFIEYGDKVFYEYEGYATDEIGQAIDTAYMSGNFVRHYQYLSVPVMVKFYTTERSKIWLEGGFSVDFLTSAKTKETVNFQYTYTDPAYSDTSYSIQNDYNHEEILEDFATIFNIGTVLIFPFVITNEVSVRDFT